MQDTLLANFTKSFHLAERYYVACFSISCGVFQVMLTYPSLNTSGAFPSDGQHACSSSTANKSFIGHLLVPQRYIIGIALLKFFRLFSFLILICD